MPSQPETVNDTVIYSEKNIYLDKDVSVRVLDSSQLDIWGDVFVNGAPLQDVGALPIATQAEAEAGVDNTKVMTPLRVSQAIDVQAGGGGAVTSVNGETGIVVLNQDEVLDGTTYKQYSQTEKTKLAGIATGATANSSDAVLLSRGNHTGTQAISTVTNLQTTLDGKQPVDTDLTTIAGLTATSNNIIQSVSSAWASRTPAQLKATMSFVKADVGLDQVDNTADTAKPVSTAQQTALDLKANLTGATFSGDISVPDEIYGGGWNGSVEVPTKNALYDKIEGIVAGGGGLTQEQVEDSVAALFAAGSHTNATVTYNDTTPSLSIAASGSGGGAVDSVNGETGVVVLNQDEVLDGTTYKQYSATEKTKLAGIATGATANATDAQLRDRGTHTGTQSADTLTDGSTNHVFTAADDTKLGGIATGATANDTDANLKNRLNHTGTQSADTITDGSTNHAFTAADDTKLTGIATGATANSSDATLLARGNHTGTQSADTVVDGSTNHVFTAADDTKLAGIATGATANSSDATLLARGNHTGTQAISTVTNLQTELDARVDTTGNETIAGTKTFSSDVLVPDEAYGGTWDGSLEVPTKNALYDKIQTIGGGSSDALHVGTSAPGDAAIELWWDTDETSTTTITLDEADSRFAKGFVADAFIAADQTGISTTPVDITGVSATFTADSTRYYKITATYMMRSTVVNDVGRVSITNASNVAYAISDCFCSSTSTGESHMMFTYVSGVSGSTTFKLRAARIAGSGTLVMMAGSAYETMILIEDIGHV